MTAGSKPLFCQHFVGVFIFLLADSCDRAIMVLVVRLFSSLRYFILMLCSNNSSEVTIWQVSNPVHLFNGFWFPQVEHFGILEFFLSVFFQNNTVLQLKLFTLIDLLFLVWILSRHGYLVDGLALLNVLVDSTMNQNLQWTLISLENFQFLWWMHFSSQELEVWIKQVLLDMNLAVSFAASIDPEMLKIWSETRLTICATSETAMIFLAEIGKRVFCFAFCIDRANYVLIYLSPFVFSAATVFCSYLGRYRL